MTRGPYILFAGDESWRIASSGATDEMRFDRDEDGKAIALAISVQLRQRGYQGEGVMFALPANWCLSAAISTADLSKQDRGAMAFRLEEKLPLAAENFTVDFAVFGDHALGVCVPNAKAWPLVDELEKAGVAVLSVSPAAMLAAQELARDVSPGDGTDQLLILGEGDQVNIISLQNGGPIAWALTQDDGGALMVQVDLALMEIGAEAGMIACEVPGSAATVLEQGGHEMSRRSERVEELAARLSGEIVSGTISPWFELRRGAMAVEDGLRAVRRPINAALAAGLILCVMLAGAFIYRSIRYDHLAAFYERSLADEFEKEFPGMAVPINPQATLLSERKRLMQAGSSALPAQAQESALRVLRDVLMRIPAGANLAIDRMTFNDTSLELDGKSRANEDVDALVSAARAAGMDVPTPQMRKDAAGEWSFIVRGSKAAKAPLATGGP